MSRTKTLGASPNPSGGPLFLWHCPKKMHRPPTNRHRGQINLYGAHLVLFTFIQRRSPRALLRDNPHSVKTGGAAKSKFQSVGIPDSLMELTRQASARQHQTVHCPHRQDEVGWGKVQLDEVNCVSVLWRIR